MVSLGALAVDMALVHGTQRSLHRVLSAAADDAAGMLDDRALQSDGTLEIDPARATRIVEAHLSLHFGGTPSGSSGRLVRSEVVVTGADRVQVSATVWVEHLFMAAVPGAPSGTAVTVSTTGRLYR